MRTIDKQKKSNVKCEHCAHWSGWRSGKCSITGAEKNYYNRCKNFCWATSLKYSKDEE